MIPRRESPSPRRGLRLGVAAAAALAASLPPAALALDLSEARHLVARTSFGESLRTLRSMARLDRQQAVDRLLRGLRTQAVVPPPSFVHAPPPDIEVRKAMRQAPQPVRQMFRREQRERGQVLKAWWLQEMIETDSPFTEWLTLFWHNHFTSSLQKVKHVQLIYRQNVVLRRHAAGSFADMLRAVARDPAMVLYLDNNSNNRKKPNENFARELLELFTLGEGHYTEQDIKQAARAFTGWKVRPQDGSFRVVRRQHDDGVKTFMGRTGALGGDDILEALLDNPRTSRYLVEKLWRALIGTAPPAEEVERLGEGLRSDGYQLRGTLRALLLHPAFWDPANRGTMIKSPVELLVGTLRTLPIPLDDTRALVGPSRNLGQDLLDPPNVKGWPGGERWITSATLLGRKGLLQRALNGIEEAGVPPPLAGLQPAQARQALLAVDPVEPIPPRLTGWKLVRRALVDPTYQLK